MNAAQVFGGRGVTRGVRDARLEHIDRIADAYLEQARALTSSELRERQPAPLSSLAHGAAGLAYFSWRAAAVKGEPSLLDDAQRWLDAAQEGLASRADWEHEPKWVQSILQGPDGILLVRILVAHARAERDEKTSLAFLSRCHDAEAAPAEFYAGAAGYLDAARLLYEATGDDRFSEAADDLAAAILRQSASFTTLPDVAFAHGRAGVLHALLRWDKAGEVTARSRAWHAEAKAALPAWLEAFASDVGKALPDAPRTPTWKRRSWCAGTAGSTLLWTAAYDWRRDAKYLERVRSSARALLLDVRLRSANLCCGHAGRAYALLGADRVDPGAGWRNAAIDAAVRASDIRSEWPNSVFLGYPGFTMLAWDLRERRPRGFPIVEA